MRAKNIVLASAAGLAVAGAAAGASAALLGAGLWRRFLASANFDGQVVVITGGSRGLGFALAQEFAARGARLVICGRDPKVLREAESKLVATGTRVLALACDISQRAEAASLIGEATHHFGRVDVLVNNAGRIAVGPLESQTLEDFETAMNTMFWGMLYTSMAVMPQMKRRHAGRIVNITSIGGKVAVPHLLPYSCAKFAAVGFSEGLRAELARSGVKVTTVVPGLMRTGSHENALFKGDHYKEYGWFSLGATLPVVSMNARRAARKIVNATARGVAQITLTPQAKLLETAHGIAPGIVTDVMGVANRLIPGSGSRDPRKFTGKESETPVTRSLLTKLGKAAGEELNQHPDEPPVGGDADASSRPPRLQGMRRGPLPAD